MEPIVRKVDHLFVPVEDVKPLFDLFTGTLGLPAAWPVTDYGTFESGGVSFGNCNVEFVRATTDPPTPFLDATVPATVRGIAFEPLDIDACDGALTERDLPHMPPVKAEAGGLSWTNCYLGGVVARKAIVFVCGYHGEPAWRDMEMDGGVIGAERLAEVTVGVQDYAKALPRWTRFLMPHEPEPEGRWHVGDGPAIHLKQSPIDGVAGITVKVRSVDAARDALKDRNLLGPSRASGVGLAHPKTWGLDVWLVE